MRIIAEQQLPTDLGTMRKFMDKATALVSGDMRSYVTYHPDDGNWVRICSEDEAS